MSKLTILDLPQRVKVARNYAVLGDYNDSLKQYKTALTIIQERFNEIAEPFLKEKWKILESEIKSEISQVSMLFELCGQFRKIPFDDKKKQENPHVMKEDLVVIKESKEKETKTIGNKRLSNQLINEKPFDNNQNNEPIIINKNEQIDKDINKQPAKDIKILVDWGKEGNKNYVINNKGKEIKENKITEIKEDTGDLTLLIDEFKNKSKDNNLPPTLSSNRKNEIIQNKQNISNPKQLNDLDETLSNLINNFKDNSIIQQPFDYKNYVASKPKAPSVEKKDPMIWEKPMPLPKKENNKKSSIPIKKPIPSSNKANIANMYKEAEKYVESKKSNNQKSNEDGKKSYLNHIYSDGNGPDSHLIQQLEEEVVDQNPCVSFEDIADLKNAKNILKEAVLFPLLMPNYFTGIRRPWKGVLLYGPPGTGKTMLAKALATQGKTTFFNVHSSSFSSKWRGESEKLVRILFEMAKFYAPTVIFIDEVDAVGSRRNSGDDDATRRVKTEFLVQMDGCNVFSTSSPQPKGEKVEVEKGKENQSKLIMILGATNRPWDLDEALIRRFEKRVYIPLPTEVGREELFRINLKDVKLEDNIDIKKLCKLTDNYSGADIANVCREAAFMGMRKRMLNNEVDIAQLAKETGFRKEIDAPISEEDLIQAIKNISKSVSNIDLKNYEDWTNEFKSI